MNFVKHTDFISYGPLGISEIRCKICGTPIAGMQERVKEVKLNKDGSRTEIRVISFVRFPQFTELKMACGLGEFHITHGCDKCLTMNLTSEALNELMEADLVEQQPYLGNEYFTEMMARMPTGILGIKVGGGIL